jgi:peptidoglycan LD-endopeptidase LytH
VDRLRVMRLISLIAICLFLWSCNGTNPIRSVFKETHPYKKYVKGLENADLDKTVLARRWIEAGERALNDSIFITLPFSESGYFKDSQPDARSYRFDAREGQVLTVNGSITTNNKADLFLDLFIYEDSTWNHIAHSDSTLQLTFEFLKDSPCLVRVQPELLVNVYYSIGISITPVLINPVAGATNRSIGSFYGASRDGGKRSHEGVDIFAEKGTPIIAPADGYVSRVGTSKLGGKVVWLKDSKRGHSYYFAHLDSQAVKAGIQLKKGDLIGTVGNTGNARYTPSHLHFGIYQSRSRDPIHYIQTLEAMTDALPWDTTFSQPEHKVISQKINLRSGPGEKHKTIMSLKKDTYVRVIAQSKNWYRIALANHKQGFVYKSMISPIDKGKKLKLKQPAVLLSGVNESTPVTTLSSNASVQVLAHFNNYAYIKTKAGVTGWLVQ